MQTADSAAADAAEKKRLKNQRKRLNAKLKKIAAKTEQGGGVALEGGGTAEPEPGAAAVQDVPSLERVTLDDGQQLLRVRFKLPSGASVADFDVVRRHCGPQIAS